MEGRVDLDLPKDFSAVSGGGEARWMRFHQGSRVGCFLVGEGLAVVVEAVVVVVEMVVVVVDGDEGCLESLDFFLPFLLAMLLHHFLRE